MIDILIIGGGAAGVAAGRRLSGEAVETLVVEAGDRLGGRGHTRDIAGMKLDLGCGWLHSADRNPWRALAEEAEVEIDRTPPAWRTQFADLGFTAEEQAEARETYAAFMRRLRETPPPSDLASDAMETGHRWNCYLEALSGFMNGAELERLSVADYLAYEDAAGELNWRLPAGFGAFITGAGDGLPVRLGAAVERIDRSGPILVAHTAAGPIEAHTVIVAVPTNVLADGRLRFTPDLPDKVEAAARLPLGLANKAFLRLDRVEPFPPDSQLFGDPRRADTGAYSLRPFGRPVIECFFGGVGARELEAEGEGAGLDFGIEQLVGLLGSEMRRRLTPLVETRWGQDPLFGGSYSHALPGHHAARAALARPVEDRIFFAGEGCSLRDFSTAHGAYETGIAAAEAALAALPSAR
ncbi:NAD(P)/FAD-dependent oxidoreductase [Sphingosinicella sp. LHD-64]|uniref:flavin monoamine oxidase family protein n=1 Tax=Sphingosinicella sp. LHD-64 TaxID=3072139 RepID=UPI0028103D93|nr:NAD(P)/FAD-dependent oxidoreductase [Sphingosinicella sp. LHD-64]MDQ8755051.1 NAD(P)/FAD-dependent oxidoreductase [Sphingosinicella sp. LHD-64]